MKNIMVPVELLERAAKHLSEGRVDGPAAHELRAILSAPSPAGVDGLKRYEVFPYLDDDVANLDICESDDGSFVKYDDAQAIIDWLRGEVERVTGLWELELARAQKAENELAHAVLTIDQQAQRIGELEGLLLEAAEEIRDLSVAADKMYGWRTLLGLRDDSDSSVEFADSIDAALSAGKEGE